MSVKLFSTHAGLRAAVNPSGEQIPVGICSGAEDLQRSLRCVPLADSGRDRAYVRFPFTRSICIAGVRSVAAAEVIDWWVL